MNKWLPAIAFSVLLLVPIGTQDVFAPIAIPNLLEARVGASSSPPEGEGFLPLGSNFDLVLSKITIETSSTTPSVGVSNYQFPGNPSDVVNGQEFVVDSFFDVFFDITIEDIDPTNNFATGLRTPIVLTDVGPVRFTVMFDCIVDLSFPNFGCLGQLPDLVSTTVIIEPLGADLDSDGTLDNIQFDSIMLPIEDARSLGGPDISTHIWFMTLGAGELHGIVNPSFSIPLSGTLIITEEIVIPAQVVGGEIIPIETVSLILAGAQSFSWMIPVVLSVLGIGLFAVSRKSE